MRQNRVAIAMRNTFGKYWNGEERSKLKGIVHYNVITQIRTYLDSVDLPRHLRQSINFNQIIISILTNNEKY